MERKMGRMIGRTFGWMYCRTIWAVERRKAVMMAIYEIYESDFETGVKCRIFSSMVFCASRLLPYIDTSRWGFSEFPVPGLYCIDCNPTLAFEHCLVPFSFADML